MEYTPLFALFVAFSSVVCGLCVYQMTKAAVAYPMLMRGLGDAVATRPVVRRCVQVFAIGAGCLALFLLLLTSYSIESVRMGVWTGLAIGAMFGIPVGTSNPAHERRFYAGFEPYIAPAAMAAFRKREAAAEEKRVAAMTPGGAVPVESVPEDEDEDEDEEEPEKVAKPAAPGNTILRYESLSKDQIIVLLQERDRTLRRMQAGGGRSKPAVKAAEVEAPAAQATQRMLCHACNGPLQDKRASFKARSGGGTVTVLMAPARVCRDCGEVYYDADVEKQLEALVQAEHKEGEHVFVDYSPGG